MEREIGQLGSLFMVENPYDRTFFIDLFTHYDLSVTIVPNSLRYCKDRLLFL
jgi:hypothetical protein